MSPPRFVHKKITADEFNTELDRQGVILQTFTRIWCQNLTTTTRWANGQNDIPTWVPIALTMMTLPNAMSTARTAAAAMIEKDTLNPQLGAFPYQRARQLPADAAARGSFRSHRMNSMISSRYSSISLPTHFLPFHWRAARP